MTCRIHGAKPLPKPIVPKWTLQINITEFFIEIHTFSLKKIHLNVLAPSWGSLVCIKQILHTA